MRKKCCYGRRRTWGQYSSLSMSPALLSHTTTITLLRKKCERLYFYEEVYLFVHWNSSLCLIMFRIYLYVLWIYPTKTWLSQLVNFKNAIWTWGHLEERYAMKFCFKLGKNARETYGMLQTAFRPSCMNRASTFEWHKRFKEGRESLRDDERCGRSKEVNTLKLISQRVRVRVTMLRF